MSNVRVSEKTCLVGCHDHLLTPKYFRQFISVQPTVSPFAEKKSKAINTVRCRGCAKRLDDMDETVNLNELDGEIWEDGHGDQFIGGTDTTLVVVPGALKVRTRQPRSVC